MEHSPATSPASSTHSVDLGSKAESPHHRWGEHRCNCGLIPAIRTSFTVQNMGMRFRCCPKKKDACPYFHFLPSEQRIQGRALELILILKERESKAVKEKEKLKQEMVALLQEKVRIADENNKLMQENINILEENVNLKDQSATMGRTVTALEKKVKKVQKKCSRPQIISHFLRLLFMVCIVGLTATISRDTLSPLAIPLLNVFK